MCLRRRGKGDTPQRNVLFLRVGVEGLALPKLSIKACAARSEAQRRRKQLGRPPPLMSPIHFAFEQVGCLLAHLKPKGTERCERGGACLPSGARIYLRETALA
jgi:hypothetical protein